MEKRRILEIMGEGISHGGEESFISNLISNMDMDGLQIDWLTPYRCNNEFYRKNLLSRGGQVYELNLSYTPGKSRHHLIEPMNRFFSEHHYDVVHIHSGSTSALAIIAQVAYRHRIKKIIVHSHTAGDNSSKSKIVKIVYSPYMRKYASEYMACTMKAAQAKFPQNICTSRIKIINNGIDLTKYQYSIEIRDNIRKELNIPQNSYVIGHVGRFSPEKNHTLIINCFEKILRKKQNCYLLLVGDGTLLDEIKKLAHTLSIEDKVRFTGYVNNVPDYYKAMNLFMLPSFFEGFAISAVEAQATGLPCILSNRIPEDTVINPNVFMLPIDDTDYAMWVEKVCEHLNDEPLSDQTELIRRGFDIKETARQIKAVYMEE